MGDLLKKAGSVISTKVLLWVGGLVGAKGFAIIGIALVIFLVLIGSISGNYVKQKEGELSVTGSGMYTCSPTGEVNMELWDSIFETSRSGALQGYGDKILEVAEEQGIDPVLFASIAMHETAWGTSNAVKNYNNPGGLMDPATGSKRLFKYNTLDEGIEAMGRTLHNRIVRDGLVTIEKLGNVYAPLGADNDPNNLNANWIPTVTSIATEDFGGLIMNCELMSEFDFDFADMDVSELRKGVATAGLKWIGSPYHWGGGRNPASASRGEFDCSSFVHWVYAENGITLGNQSSVTTETLKHMGERISIDEIKVGDLIFWDTYKKDGHVGIYVGNGKWIGTQSSTGVAIVDFNNSYWKSVFSGHVRRIIPD